MAEICDELLGEGAIEPVVEQDDLEVLGSGLPAHEDVAGVGVAVNEPMFEYHVCENANQGSPHFLRVEPHLLDLFHLRDLRPLHEVHHNHSV